MTSLSKELSTYLLENEFNNGNIATVLQRNRDDKIKKKKKKINTGLTFTWLYFCYYLLLLLFYTLHNPINILLLFSIISYFRKI